MYCIVLVVEMRYKQMCVLPLKLDFIESKEVRAYGRSYTFPYYRFNVFNNHKYRLIVYYIHNVDR